MTRRSSKPRAGLRWLAAAVGLAAATYTTWAGTAWFRYGHVSPPREGAEDPLLDRFMPLTTGLIVGALWGAWHIMGHVVLASGTYSGTLPRRVFVVTRVVGLLIGGLPAYRVLMVWVYDRTGSLLVVMVMHVSLTASTLMFDPVGISGAALLVYDLISIVAWWTVIALIVLANRGLFFAVPDLETDGANGRMGAPG